MTLVNGACVGYMCVGACGWVHVYGCVGFVSHLCVWVLVCGCMCVGACVWVHGVWVRGCLCMVLVYGVLCTVLMYGASYTSTIHKHYTMHHT